MPWALAKDEAQQDRLAEVLYNLTESITIGASLLHSFLPETAEKIVAQLNTTLRSSMTLTNLVFMRAVQRLQTNLRSSSAD